MTGPPSRARTDPEAKLTGLSRKGGPASRPAPTVSILSASGSPAVTSARTIQTPVSRHGRRVGPAALGACCRGARFTRRGHLRVTPSPGGVRNVAGGRTSTRQEQQMKLTIFAATGGVGRQLLEQAVADGHDVTAVARNPGKLTRQVRTVTADLAAADPGALAPAVAGADAVLSGLGPHSNADAGIAAPGTRSIVAAMKATGVRRIVVVSAAPVGTVASPGNPSPPRHDPGDGFFMRYLFSRIAAARFGKVYDDLALMEDVLRD